MRATSTHSSTLNPVLTPSSKLIFAITAIVSGTTDFTRFAIVRAKRARFSNEPPQPSFLLLSLGLRKLLIKYPCPKCNSRQSKPDLAASTAAFSKSFITRNSSSSVAGLVFLKRDFEKTFEADIALPPIPIPTGPACPSCIDAATSRLCIASTKYRNPGTASSRTTISFGAPCPSGETAQ